MCPVVVNRFGHVVLYLCILASFSSYLMRANCSALLLNSQEEKPNPYLSSGFQRIQIGRSGRENLVEKQAKNGTDVRFINPFGLLGNPGCQHHGKEGTCYDIVQCGVLGGNVGAICRRFTGVCCTFTRGCTQRSSQEVVYFSNHKYDGILSNTILSVFAQPASECELQIIKKTENFCGLRIEPSVDAKMIPPGASADANQESCADAILSVVGLGDRLDLTLCSKRDSIEKRKYDIDISAVENLKLKISAVTRSGAPVDVKVKQLKCEEFKGEDLSGTLMSGGGTTTGGGFGGGGGSGGTGGTGGIDGVKPPAPPIPITDKPPGPPSPPPAGASFSGCGMKGPGRRSRLEPLDNIKTHAHLEGQENGPQGPPILSLYNLIEGSNVQVNRQGRQDPPPSWDVPTNNETIFGYLMGDASQQNKRITNGIETTPNEYPWQVAIFKSDNKFHCGASIIGDFYVLTAAHCVISFVNSPQSIMLRLGEWSLSGTSEGQHFNAQASKISVHPEYSRTNLQNDIAVVKLQQRINFNARMRPVCLPRTDIPLTGELATVTGWGKNERGSLVDRMNELTAEIMDNADCSTRWGGSGFIKPSMMCMNSKIGDSCNGDSGGPTVIEYPANSGKYTQVGVVSFGSGSCTDKNLPGVYSRVAYFRDWILRQMI